MESDDPPRKNYEMKEREFVRVNAPAGSARGPAVAPGVRPEQVDPNDIHSMLLQNRAIERRHGKDAVADNEPKKSRRKREFWLLLVGGNLAVVASVTYGSINPVSLIFGLAGLILFSIGLTWIMWFVMDDY
jgi:hypothetical protein